MEQYICEDPHPIMEVLRVEYQGFWLREVSNRSKAYYVLFVNLCLSYQHTSICFHPPLSEPYKKREDLLGMRIPETWLNMYGIRPRKYCNKDAAALIMADIISTCTWYIIVGLITLPGLIPSVCKINHQDQLDQDEDKCSNESYVHPSFEGNKERLTNILDKTEAT